MSVLKVLQIVVAWVGITATLNLPAQANEGPVDTRSIIVGLDHWPPYSNKDNPESGVIYSLVKEAFLKSGYSITVKSFPAGRLVASLKQNKYMDMSCTLWKTSEREKTLLFSEPFLENSISLFTHKSQKINLEQKERYRLGIIRGYSYGVSIDTILGNNRTIAKLLSAEELFKMLLANRIDLALADERVADWATKNIGAIGEVIKVKSIISNKGLHCAVSKNHPRGKELITAFNRGIGLLNKD